MKLALFGTTGMIGSRIFKEAVLRGHQVTAVMRDPSRLQNSTDQVRTARGDVLIAADIAAAVRGHDAVVSAVGPGPGVIVGAVHAFMAALPAAGVRRLVAVGGAGSLEVASKGRFIEAPDFPQEYLEQAQAGCEALDLYRGNQALDWTVICPAIWITPGERTGQFRKGGDQLLFDAQGESRISAEDFAMACLDEVEQSRHIRQRITVAY